MVVFTYLLIFLIFLPNFYKLSVSCSYMFNVLRKKIQKLLGKTSKELEKAKEEKVEEKKEEVEEKEKKPEEVKKKKGFIAGLRRAVITTKLKEKDFDSFFSELEIILIENNVALEAIEFLQNELKKELVNKEIRRGEIAQKINETLEKAISELLLEPFDLIARVKEKLKEKKPYVIIFFGINGSGKTTTIAKFSYMLKEQGITNVLAASDTFRAASIEQLEEHAKKLGVEIIKHKYGADPAAVAFDAIAHAKSKGIDVVLVDTAGRMHVKVNLMREMEKICRVAKPDLKIFVGESIVGNDAVEQARSFNETVGIDAIILTKADVDEKGGACISVGYVIKKPIIFLGVGQSLSALKSFNPKQIVKSLGL